MLASYTVEDEWLMDGGPSLLDSCCGTQLSDCCMIPRPMPTLPAPSNPRILLFLRRSGEKSALFVEPVSCGCFALSHIPERSTNMRLALQNSEERVSIHQFLLHVNIVQKGSPCMATRSASDSWDSNRAALTRRAALQKSSSAVRSKQGQHASGGAKPPGRG